MAQIEVVPAGAPAPAAAGRALVPAGPGARNRRLILQHPVFNSFEASFFRICEAEGKAILVIPLGDQEASLSLDGMRREFRIPRDSEDGVMLGLVARGLEFVTGLRVGDWLPTEILTGEASWTADEAFQERAWARLNLFLLAWMADGASSAAREVLSRVGQAPVSTESLEAGLRLMASKVGSITAGDAMARIRQVADEFAYIESLRDWLLRGAARMATVLNRVAHTFRGDSTHKEILAQVRRLASIGVSDLQARFDQADSAVADIEKVVVDPDGVEAALRRHRDALHVRWRAWEPFIVEWGTIEIRQNAKLWQLVHETYRFLAPRFMTIVEWRSVPDGGQAARLRQPGMDW